VRFKRFPLQPHRVCLLLGSNIQPEKNLHKAIDELANNFFVEQVSGVWESAAVGSNGANFLNAAVILRTPLRPYQLKEGFLRPLEAKLGRVRTANKNAPRTIDIESIVDADVWKYAHAAVPVAELLPCYQSEVTGEYLEHRAASLRHTTSIIARQDVSRHLQHAYTYQPFVQHLS
jgi:2-amino-4-hydroxy-6-hydroxymethyldihydropteridine diphosphokinase